MLQEELRRYRQRVGEQEGLLSAKERQLVALRDELQRQTERLQQCSVAPDQLLQEQQFRQMLQDRCSKRESGRRPAGTGACAATAVGRSFQGLLLISPRAFTPCLHAGMAPSSSWSSAPPFWSAPSRPASGGSQMTWRRSGGSRRS